MIKRKASAIWQGGLKDGKGTISSDSGVLKQTQYSFGTRFENGPGTNPEELIAAAHAACFAMAFAHSLSQDGRKPERLAISANVTFDRVEGGMKVTRSALDVRGIVPGLDQSGFQAAAEKAEKGCPVSNALRGDVDITVRATLDG